MLDLDLHELRRHVGVVTQLLGLRKARLEQMGTVPVGGTPEEFGRVAAFVTSPAASYLSGIALPVDGGSLRTL